MCACTRAGRHDLSKHRVIWPSGHRVIECAVRCADDPITRCPALLSGSLCASFKDVEHPCQQCGTAVEDGRPFCPQCRAPQIHVQVAISDAEDCPGARIRAGRVFSGNSSRRGLPRLRRGKPRPEHAGQGKCRSCRAQGGVLGVFIGVIPFLGMVLTGALAVFFYRRENGFVASCRARVASWRGAGVVAFAINALLITSGFLFFMPSRNTSIS